MRITLDVPPSGNVYWRHNRGRTHRSHEANAYRDYVALLCRTAGIDPIEGDVALKIVFYRPSRRYDLDNIFKQLFDSFQGALIINDSQIAAIDARRDDTEKHCPRLEIEVREL